MNKELEEAVAIIERICASVQGTLADHQVIQHALTLIKAELTPPVVLAAEPLGVSDPPSDTPGENEDDEDEKSDGANPLQ